MNSETFWDNRYSHKKGCCDYVGRRNIIAHDVDAALAYFGDVKNKRIVDLGCGRGEASLIFARHGAHVISVDTSSAAIDRLTAYCAENNIANITPLGMSAYDISDIDTADFVFGSMILHHLRLFDEFSSALREFLPDDGKAFFVENRASSAMMMWFRQNVAGKWWVPKYGDSDEFPLTSHQIEKLKEHFHVQITYPRFVFFGLFARYALRGHLLREFVLLDDLCFKIPCLRKYSYHQYLYLSP
jgi:2-polyprenyl-3-methyl-5-hydroxy-6-metoxy-1,4-benzoquinol methylase